MYSRLKEYCAVTQYQVVLFPPSCTWVCLFLTDAARFSPRCCNRLLAPADTVPPPGGIGNLVLQYKLVLMYSLYFFFLLREKVFRWVDLAVESCTPKHFYNWVLIDHCNPVMYREEQDHTARQTAPPQSQHSQTAFKYPLRNRFVARHYAALLRNLCVRFERKVKRTRSRRTSLTWLSVYAGDKLSSLTFGHIHCIF